MSSKDFFAPSEDHVVVRVPFTEPVHEVLTRLHEAGIDTLAPFVIWYDTADNATFARQARAWTGDSVEMLAMFKGARTALGYRKVPR